ncbi:hypothetical protein [Streptomyces sp.]|uniref:hypothetical protein n=1 Tax=Streptomyces sp. TaxID=1931 RepID=UPI002F934219
MTALWFSLALTLAATGSWLMRDRHQPGKHSGAQAGSARLLARPNGRHSRRAEILPDLMEAPDALAA